MQANEDYVKESKLKLPGMTEIWKHDFHELVHHGLHTGDMAVHRPANIQTSHWLPYFERIAPEETVTNTILRGTAGTTLSTVNFRIHKSNAKYIEAVELELTISESGSTAERQKLLPLPYWLERVEIWGNQESEKLVTLYDWSLLYNWASTVPLDGLHMLAEYCSGGAKRGTLELYPHPPPNEYGYKNTFQTVTQLTSKSTGVTINARQGTIIFDDASLAAAGTVAAIVSNVYVTTDSIIKTWIVDNTSGDGLSVSVAAQADGLFTLNLTNNFSSGGSGASTATPKIYFEIVDPIKNAWTYQIELLGENNQSLSDDSRVLKLPLHGDLVHMWEGFHRDWIAGNDYLTYRFIFRDCQTVTDADGLTIDQVRLLLRGKTMLDGEATTIKNLKLQHQARIITEWMYKDFSSVAYVAGTEHSFDLDFLKGQDVTMLCIQNLGPSSATIDNTNRLTFKSLDGTGNNHAVYSLRNRAGDRLFSNFDITEYELKNMMQRYFSEIPFFFEYDTVGNQVSAVDPSQIPIYIPIGNPRAANSLVRSGGLIFLGGETLRAKPGTGYGNGTMTTVRIWALRRVVVVLQSNGKFKRFDRNGQVQV